MSAGELTPSPDVPLLQARELARHYSVRRGWFSPPATVRALDGVSFELRAGRTLAVVGESGCGKSTLARALTLIETPTSGELRIQGQDAADVRTHPALRRQVQMVFQNPYASLNPRKTIASTLAEPLVINTRLTRAERQERIEALAAKVGLRHEHLARYPHMFSGGQRQRIAIARAMVLQPGIVVADEPTSALDLSIQAQILNLFMDLQDEFGTGYVFISHNLAVVEHVADEVMVMYLGRVVEQGDKRRLFAQPLHPYTQALISATPALRAADRRERIRIHGELPSPLKPPSGCAFHQRCPLAVPRCAEVRPALREVAGRWVACDVI
ncbi:dipeptide ABC transporter ATP-binding protein [Roseateles amylovorans]|uniref:Dipeptide ABC transporter ATP-binding protein n=1 Tax=Roseateles amylovorans TaxID=2978473 RepID=A0ABY6B622_9BURK|nr:dipeptide ABC transporter ATP-binding protein [Roseateles amylovorans]UXH78680.1 dipeptide ABC transporter ATP-binding protein [Roseateles amylovorans]